MKAYKLPVEESGALRIIRLPEVTQLVGLSRSTVLRYSKRDPTFPKPVKLSRSQARNAPVGYVLKEVQEWLQSQIEARDPE